MESMIAAATATTATPLEFHVVAAADGDREAFGRLVEETKSMVSSITLAVVGDADASQDIAQDVFLAAWKGIGQLRNPASFLPWLRQTARFRSRTWLRDQSRRRETLTATDESQLNQAADPGPSATERIALAEERRLLSQALQELPDETREIVVLYYREGRSVEQVATLLEMNPDAVKQRLSRARRRLRDDVARRLERAVVASAPQAAFTAAVLTALTASAPSAAAMAMGSAAKASAGLLPKVTAVLGSVGLGILGGGAGVVFGLRCYFRNARDENERRQLWRFQTVALTMVVTVAMTFLVSGWLESEALAIGGFAAFMVGLWLLYFVWLPRIVGQERLAGGKEANAATLRQARFLRAVGFVGGFLCGLAGLLMGLYGF